MKTSFVLSVTIPGRETVPAFKNEYVVCHLVPCDFRGHLYSDETNPRGGSSDPNGAQTSLPSVCCDTPEQCVSCLCHFVGSFIIPGRITYVLRGCTSQRVEKAGCGSQNSDGAAMGKRRTEKEEEMRAKPSPLWAGELWLLPTSARGCPLCRRTVLSRAPPAGSTPLTLSL